MNTYFFHSGPDSLGCERRNDRLRIERIEMEVFLDFDPVFPGWPPEDLAGDDRIAPRAAARDAGSGPAIRRSLPPAPPSRGA